MKIVIRAPNRIDEYPVWVEPEGWVRFKVVDNPYGVEGIGPFFLVDELPVETRQKIIRQLFNDYQQEAVPILIGALSDREWRVRLLACEMLGLLGDRRAVPALIQALVDSQMPIRLAASNALGKLRDTRAVRALIQALRDRDPFVREAACYALGNIGDRRAISALRVCTQDRKKRVRQAARTALRRIDRNGRRTHHGGLATHTA